MLDWVEALTLGIVQGLTEFLPISSDGHLATTQKLFGWIRGVSSSAADDLFFVVIVHIGTLVAILLRYRTEGRMGAQGLLGSEQVPTEYRRNSVVRAGLLAVLATMPAAVVGLFLKKQIEATFASPAAAAIGFLITAGVLLLTMGLKSGHKGLNETTWVDALAVGVAQAFAPLPGVSRSGTTIAAGLALGFTKTWAVGFSLLMAIPAIAGAELVELKDVDYATLTPDFVARCVAASVVSGVVGYVALVWLVRVVRSGKLWYFSVYLVALALVIFATLWLGGDRAHAVPPAAENGAVRGAPAVGLPELAEPSPR
ncbi:undecaprenyl-diphosphate phosphatase [Isosphaeraceae bacterium EP7]